MAPHPFRPAPRQAGSPGLRLALLLGLFAAPGGLSSAAAQATTAQPARQSYDIPAQDLETALLALGRLSGIDVLYKREALVGRRSAPVTGVLTPQAAVALMLAGAPLTHRFTSPTAVLVLSIRSEADEIEAKAAANAVGGAAAPRLTLGRLRVNTGPVIGGRPPQDYAAFGQLVRATIARRLQDDPRTRGRAFSLRLAVELDAQGAIRTLRVTRQTGVELDRTVVRALAGTVLPQSPPANMPQPIWLEIVAK